MPIIFDEDTGNGMITTGHAIRFGGFQQDGKTGPLSAHVFKSEHLYRWANDPEYIPMPICGMEVQKRISWMGITVFGHLDVLCRDCLKKVDQS